MSAPRLCARSLPALLALVAVTTARPARAWVEAHVVGDDARVTIERSGVAHVEHRVTLKIAGGPLKSFDVRGIDRDAVLEPDGYAVPARDAATNSLAGATPLTTELLADDPRAAAKPPGVRIRFDDKGIGRGLFVVSFRYTSHPAIRKQGALASIRWQGPIWEDGFESARATFVLPPAPTEPRADEAPAGGRDEDAEPNAPTFLSTVKRSGESDEIQLLRPYTSKGEPVVWAIRVDARAFTDPSADRTIGPAPPPATLDLLEPARRALVLGSAAALFLLYALMVILKSREVRAQARARGTVATPLVPLPAAVRAPLAGLALVAGVALELMLATGTAGAALVAVATALAAHRTPAWTHASRGPGRWLPISEEEAFERLERPRGAHLDATTRTGKVLLVLALAALAAGVVATLRTSAYHATLIGLDAAALLAIFCTGRIAELLPDAVAGRAPFLRDVSRRIRRHLAKDDADGLRVVPRIRVPDRGADPDELRIGVVPRSPLAGFGAIEVGVVFVPGAGGAIRMPEILLRFTAGSDCERAMSIVARRGRSTRGRRPDERVIAFSPRLPTARMTAAIAAALAVRATDRGRKATPARPRRAA